MAWQGILGHDAIVERFRRSLRRDRLGSTFLFVGPAGVGKRMFAERLAQALLCTRIGAEEMAPCGTCDACRQVMSHSHPDFYIVEKPADKSAIPVALLVGDEAHRMREGLCHDIALKPFMGGRKVAIIDDADFLNEEGANCLLKTLEEPPPRSVLILIGTSADRQLPTIRSRCQTVRFGQLDDALIGELLLASGAVEDAASAERIATVADGSLERARELAEGSVWEFRAKMLDHLAGQRIDSLAFGRELVAFVEAAGKDAPPRRARARLVISLTIDFYRQLLRATCGASIGGDALQNRAVERAAQGSWEPDGLAAAIDRSLEAIAHVDRNAHQATLLECWVDDLARIQMSGEAVAPYRG